MSTEPASGLCLDCDYSLRGLTDARCPECGRTFDPNDPRTMNMGRPMPRIVRRILRPYGAVVFGMSIPLGLLALYGMMFPSFYYMLAIVLVVYGIFLAGIVWFCWEVLRQGLAWRYRQKVSRGVQFGWRALILLWAVVLIVLYLSQLPLRIGFWVWHDDWDQLAAEARVMLSDPNVNLATYPPGRRIGWYTIDTVREIDCGYMFYFANDIEGGFAWTNAPRGMDGQYNEGSDGWLGGHWYWYVTD